MEGREEQIPMHKIIRGFLYEEALCLPRAVRAFLRAGSGAF